MAEGSRIFLRNRALGYVSNHIPCINWYHYKRREHIIVTCIGKAIHTYDVNHLKLLTVSVNTESDITAIAGDVNFIYTASGGKIQKWKRATTIDCCYGYHKTPIHVLASFGTFILAVDKENLLKVWNKENEELVLNVPMDPLTFLITCLVQPHTYVNKILIGSEQGGMQLWNIRKGKLIHDFRKWQASVRVLEQAPAIDIVAVGLSDGSIILHNIKIDKTLVQFSQDEGCVTSISFRTDGPPIMAVGSETGSVTFWNLEDKKFDNVLEAHKDTVCSIIFIYNEPLMITSSSDNTLKVWIFDQSDNSARILRFREGHCTQPNIARFYPGNEVHVLTASGDSTLRVFNIVSESLNFSLGRAAYNKNKLKNHKDKAQSLLMPQITEFSISEMRASEWDNIAALHLNSFIVSTWSYTKRTMGEHKLVPDEFKKSIKLNDRHVTATCLHMTNCGNFVTIGYSCGYVIRYNVQSGKQRFFYGEPSAHKRAIRGVASDQLNQLVISGCSDGLLKFWKFGTKLGSSSCPTPLSILKLDHQVSLIRVHKESTLISVILENFTIILVDIETRKVVRKFIGHSSQVTDLTFSPDARWLISASMDSTIRTWDIPTSSLVDIFQVDTPCISIDMSPNSLYLATVHIDHLGIFIWTNRTTFSHVPLLPIKDNPHIPRLEMPLSCGVEPIITVVNQQEEENNEMNDEIEQIEDLVTLSGLPSSRWQHLLDIDLIKKRNKNSIDLRQKEIIKSAPFFLPTEQSKPFIQFTSSTDNEENNLENLKKRNQKQIHNSPFANALAKATITGKFNTVVDKLKEMGASKIDLEISTLSFSLSVQENLLIGFLKMIQWMFSTNKNFELAQSYLSLYLKVHSEILLKNENLQKELEKVLECQSKSWENIQDQLMYSLCIIDILKQPENI